MEAEYFRIHNWIIYHYGKASKCENPSCSSTDPKRFEWALRKGEIYEKNVNNFIQLCPSCHRKYDFTEETRVKISKGKKGHPAKNKVSVVLNDIQEFESLTQAARITGISIKSINNNLKGRSKSTKLGIWKYQQKN